MLEPKGSPRVANHEQLDRCNEDNTTTTTGCSSYVEIQLTPDSLEHFILLFADNIALFLDPELRLQIVMVYVDTFYFSLCRK